MRRGEKRLEAGMTGGMSEKAKANEQAKPTPEIPAELSDNVRALKAHFPYRICWGAFKANDANDTFCGADYDKRRLNAKLRQGYLAFIAS